MVVNAEYAASIGQFFDISVAGISWMRAERVTPGMGINDRFSKVLQEVNQLQLDSGEAANKFVSGEIKDVHDVMIAAEKASVSLELTLEVRNKLVEAYREIMRIQM